MTPFYPKIIKKSITAFGKLFSDIKIQRFDNADAVVQTIAVPIAYANKQKWLTRIEQDPKQENYTLISLPRMGFEITSYAYDPSRKSNKNTRVQKSIDGTNTNTQYTPVPYNIGISLYLQTKNVEDGLQCMEQIIPYFTPDYSLSITAVDDLDIINSVPLVLNGVSVEDDYEGDFTTRRSIIHTFDFTMKLNLFGPVTRSGVIKHVAVNFPDQKIGYRVSSDVPGIYTEDQWIETF